MGFDDYQKKAATFEVPSDYRLEALVLGLVGEAGEVAEKFKKIYRDKNGAYSPSDVNELKKELGDVLWYTAVLAKFFDHSLQDIADTNIEKLSDRKTRNVITGKGDNR
jgi:NTP pyrophosphatase (non-canonical NTP hydrolase)